MEENNRCSVGLFICSFFFRARTWNCPTSTALLLYMISFSAHSHFPVVHLSSLGYHHWGIGEACSWHASAPPTVYIRFTHNPVHSLKGQSINTVRCWSTTLRPLAASLHCDLLRRGYCFHPNYYLWFARILHTCFIPLFNIEEYHIAHRNNTKWLPRMLLHWYYLNW